MLYYAVASHVGQLGVLGARISACRAAAGPSSAGASWGTRPRGSSLTFAGTAPFIMMVGGTYPFLA